MLKILRNLVLFVIFLLPLFSPEMFPALNLLYPGAVFFLFLLFVIYWMFFQEKQFNISAPLLPVLLLALTAAISGLFSSFGFNLAGQKLVFGALLFVITVNVFSREADRRSAIYALLFALVFTGLFAFYQKWAGMADMAVYLTAHKETVSDLRIYEEFLKNISSGRVFSSFLNSNVYAGFISLAFFPVIGFLFLSEKSNVKKYFAGLALAMSLFALFLTKSGAGLVTLFAGAIVFLFVTVKDKKKWFLYTGVFVLACGLSVLLLRPDIFDLAKEDNSILNRLTYFKDAFRIFCGAPLLGSGPETYIRYSALGVKYPHNWYLQVLAETGLLGFSALVFFLTVFFRESYRTAVKLTEREKYLFAGFFAGFCSYLVHNLFDIDSNMWQNSLLALFLAGLTAAFFKSNKTSAKAIVLPASPATGIGANWVFILSAGALTLAAVFARFGQISFLLAFLAIVPLFLLVISSLKKYLKTTLDLPLTLLLILFFLSMGFSVNRFATLHALYILLGAIMLYYAVVNSVKTAEDFNKYKIFLAALSVLLAVGGIVETLFFSAARTYGFFTNPNFLGGFLAAGVGMLLFFLLDAKGKTFIFYAFSLVLSVWCIALTKSRGALLILFICLLIFLVLLVFLVGKKAVKENTRKYITITVLLFFALAASPVNPIMKRAFKVGGDDAAAFSRVKIWKAAGQAFLDRPFFGSGVNTYKDAMLPHYFPVGGTIGNFTRVPDMAHNEYLQILAEAGIAGGLILLVFFFVFLKRLKFLLNETKDKGRLLAICAVFNGLAGLLLHSLFDFNLHVLPTLLLFVILVGIFFSGYFASARSIFIQAAKYPRLGVYISVLTAVFAVAAIMASASLYFLNKKAEEPESRERNLKLSSFLNPLNGESFAETGKMYKYGFRETRQEKYFLEAERNIKKAAVLEPLNPYYRRNLGLLYFDAGLAVQAREEYLTAIKLAPFDVFFKLELATIFAEGGKLDYAKDYALSALKLEPNFAGARQFLAKVHYNLGEKKAAEYQFKKAVEINSKYKDKAVIDYEKMLVELDGTVK